MKFTIEVEEFWLEEEEINDVLSSHIKNSVVFQISESIKDKVEKQITSKVDEVVEDKLSLIIDEKLTDLINTEEIIKNGKMISIEEHIKNVFQNNSGWNNPNVHIDRIAKKFGEELKIQYNNAFANQIVLNMKKQGFLKNDVVKVLLGNGE